MTNHRHTADPVDTGASSFARASRREFLKGSTATMMGAAAATSSVVSAAPLVYAGGSETIKVGLVGCGGRGTGAATQALTADSGTKLLAMADVFGDRLDSSLSELLKEPTVCAARRCSEGAAIHRL